MAGMCMRCLEWPATDAAEQFCGHCHWAIRSEIERGFRELDDYLLQWARFRAWEEERS